MTFVDGFTTHSRLLSFRYIVVPSKAKGFIAVVEDAKKAAEKFDGYITYALVKTVVRLSSYLVPAKLTYNFTIAAATSRNISYMATSLSIVYFWHPHHHYWVEMKGQCKLVQWSNLCNLQDDNISYYAWAAWETVEDLKKYIESDSAKELIEYTSKEDIVVQVSGVAPIV